MSTFAHRRPGAGRPDRSRQRPLSRRDPRRRATGVLLVAVVAYGGWIGFGPLMARLSLALGGDRPPADAVRGLAAAAARVPRARRRARRLSRGLRPPPAGRAPARARVLSLTRTTTCCSSPSSSARSAWCCACSSPGGWSPTSSARTCSGAAPARWTAARGPRPRAATATASASRSARWPASPGSSSTAGSTSPPASRPSASSPPRCSASPRWRCTRAWPRGHAQLLSGTRTLSLARPPVALARRRAGARRPRRLDVGLGARRPRARGGGGTAGGRGARVGDASGGGAGARSTQRTRARVPRPRRARRPPSRPGSRRPRRAWTARPSPASCWPRRAPTSAWRSTATPTNPWLHLDLAWVEATDAAVLEQAGSAALAAAMTHGARAVALGRDSALFYAAMARLAYSMPELGLRAAREAVQRQPALLAEMVELYRPLGLTDTEWLALAPPTGAIAWRWRCCSRAGGSTPTRSPSTGRRWRRPRRFEAGVCRWALAEALGRAGAGGEAVQVLRAALAADPGNPELERALGAALARENDPEALDRLRAAVTAMERRPAAGERRPFAVPDARLAALISRLAPRSRPHRALPSRARRLSHRAPPVGPGPARVARARARRSRATPRRASASAWPARGWASSTRRWRTSARRSRSIRARPATGDGWPQRLWQGEQYFQAINEWRVLAEQQPRDVESRLALGRAFEKVGQPVDAYRQYRDVLGPRSRAGRRRPRHRAPRRSAPLASRARRSPRVAGRRGRGACGVGSAAPRGGRPLRTRLGWAPPVGGARSCVDGNGPSDPTPHAPRPRRPRMQPRTRTPARLTAPALVRT